MKTFEERYTAWIDDRLAGPELEAFEQELAAHPNAATDKLAARQLGGLLRQHGRTPALTNADFFNHQLMARIEAETAPRNEERSRAGRFAWPLPHLAWAGVCCLLVAVTIYKTAISPTPSRESHASAQMASASHAPAFAPVAASPAPRHFPYEAEIIGAQAEDPNISVTPVHSVEDDMTVLWVDGLDYLPASYQLQ